MLLQGIQVQLLWYNKNLPGGMQSQGVVFLAGRKESSLVPENEIRLITQHPTTIPSHPDLDHTSHISQKIPKICKQNRKKCLDSA